MSTGACVNRQGFVVFKLNMHEYSTRKGMTTFTIRLKIFYLKILFQNTKYKRLILKVLRLKKCSVTLPAYTVLIPIDL
jgi:hypothetical protein